MLNPVLVAVEDDADALRDIERELRDRYARHYRVVCMRSPHEARARLEDLAAAGDEVALVLAGQWLSGTTGSELLDETRHLHPHAKRGLLISWGDWGDRATGEAIFDSIARGRIDHYVVRPSASPDELFHQAISSLLLEWAEAQHVSPNTIHVVGESWSGRAFELRERTWALRDPALVLPGRLERRARFSRRGGEGDGAPDRHPSRRNGADRPQQRRAREGVGLAGEPGADGFRPPDRRRRAGRPVGSRLWRLGRIRHPGRRRRRPRRPGDLQLADPQLPRLPSRGQRSPSGSAGVRAGVGLRGELRVHAEGDRPSARARRAFRHPLRLRPASVRARCSWRRAPAIADWASRRSRR